jgi:hypothetical protein
VVARDLKESSAEGGKLKKIREKFMNHSINTHSLSRKNMFKQ